MWAIITGGRDYNPDALAEKWVEEMYMRYQAKGILIGDCPTGVDRHFDEYFQNSAIEMHRFEADWDKHGKVAGPIRNQKMAQYATMNGGGVVFALPGGKGTENMKIAGLAAGLFVVQFVPKT